MNIHNCMKRGGIAVHLVPDVTELDERGWWKGHCNYYYSHDFFEALSKMNGSTLLSSFVLNGLRYACMRKDEDIPFTSNKDAILSRIAIRRQYGAFSYMLTNPILRHIDYM